MNKLMQFLAKMKGTNIKLTSNGEVIYFMFSTLLFAKICILLLVYCL